MLSCVNIKDTIALICYSVIDKKETKTLRACNSKTPLPFYPDSILFSARFVNHEEKAFEDLKGAAIFAQNFGLKVNAGHGLNYQNVKNV